MKIKNIIEKMSSKSEIILIWILAILSSLCFIWLVNVCIEEDKVMKQEKSISIKEKKIIIADNTMETHVINIDGCEYITYGIHGFSHKGNCTNCIKRTETK
jgi:hypothetical protein